MDASSMAMYGLTARTGRGGALGCRSRTPCGVTCAAAVAPPCRRPTANGTVSPVPRFPHTFMPWVWGLMMIISPAIL